MQPSLPKPCYHTVNRKFLLRWGDIVKAILIGILGALFFSVTFILNRSMELDGGSWVWSASLRFIFMLLILLIIVGWRRDIQPVWAHLKQHPAAGSFGVRSVLDFSMLQ